MTQELLSDIKEFFYSKCIKAPDGCWYWNLSLDSAGYGLFQSVGKKYKAHRFSYWISKGEIGDLCVCHSCDNRNCVNPDHLWLGSEKDNYDDMVNKNRRVILRGIRHGCHRLKENQVLEIKRKLRNGVKPRHVAIVFGISDSAIFDIKAGRTWGHIQLPDDEAA